MRDRIRNFLRRLGKFETILEAAVIAKEHGRSQGSFSDKWEYRDDQIAIEHIYRMGKWDDKVFHVTIEWHGTPVAEYIWDSPFADFASTKWERFNPGDWCDYVGRLYKPIQDKRTREYRERFEAQS